MVQTWSRRCLGSEFYVFGPATEKARRPCELVRYCQLMTGGRTKMMSWGSRRDTGTNSICSNQVERRRNNALSLRTRMTMQSVDKVHCRRDETRAISRSRINVSVICYCDLRDCQTIDWVANYCARGLVAEENRPMKSLNHDTRDLSRHDSDNKKWQTMRTPTLLCCFTFWLRNNIKSGPYGSAMVTRQVSNLLVVHLF